MGDGNVKVQNGWGRGGTEKESKERAILIVGAILGLGRSLVLGKFPGNHNDEPS